MSQSPASEKQVALITRLLGEKDLTGTRFEGHTAAPAGLTGGKGGSASEAIDDLFRLPSRDLPKAEPGFYVRGDEAFKVQANKAGTSTYALRWTGSGWEYAPGVGKTLADLAPMTAEAAARIGLASGHCVSCAKPLGGATLTARVAALVGYGEICAGNHGWPFPKGAAAQRARLAEGLDGADAAAEEEHREGVFCGGCGMEDDGSNSCDCSRYTVPDSPASLFTGHYAGETTTSRFD